MIGALALFARRGARWACVLGGFALTSPSAASDAAETFAARISPTHASAVDGIPAILTVSGTAQTRCRQRFSHFMEQIGWYGNEIESRFLGPTWSTPAKTGSLHLELNVEPACNGHLLEGIRSVRVQVLGRSERLRPPGQRGGNQVSEDSLRSYITLYQGGVIPEDRSLEALPVNLALVINEVDTALSDALVRLQTELDNVEAAMEQVRPWTRFEAMVREPALAHRPDVALGVEVVENHPLACRDFMRALGPFESTFAEPMSRALRGGAPPSTVPRAAVEAVIKVRAECSGLRARRIVSVDFEIHAAAGVGTTRGRRARTLVRSGSVQIEDPSIDALPDTMLRAFSAILPGVRSAVADLAAELGPVPETPTTTAADAAVSGNAEIHLACRSVILGLTDRSTHDQTERARLCQLVGERAEALGYDIADRAGSHRPSEMSLMLQVEALHDYAATGRHPREPRGDRGLQGIQATVLHASDDGRSWTYVLEHVWMVPEFHRRRWAHEAWAHAVVDATLGSPRMATFLEQRRAGATVDEAIYQSRQAPPAPRPWRGAEVAPGPVPTEIVGLPLAVTRPKAKRLSGTFNEPMVRALSEEAVRVGFTVLAQPFSAGVPCFELTAERSIFREPPDAVQLRLDVVQGERRIALFELSAPPIDDEPEGAWAARAARTVIAKLTVDPRLIGAVRHLAEDGSLDGIAEAARAAGEGGVRPRLAYRSDWPAILTPPDGAGPAPSEDVAVIVGFEDYAFLPPAPFAKRDAEAFEALARGPLGIAADRIWRIDSGSNAHIERAIDEAARAVGPRGRAWFYFAGHAVSSPTDGAMLLLGDDARADPGLFVARGIDVGVIEERLAARAAQTFVILDAAPTGEGRGGAPLLAGTRFVVPTWVGRATPTATRRWIASRDHAPAVFEDLGHGAFSYLVIGALRGWADGAASDPDGQITDAEVRAFVRARLSERGVRASPEWGGPPDPAPILSTAFETWRGSP